MLHIGDKVPDFTLPLVHADGKKDVSFHEFLHAAKGPVVIGFFPMAFTGLCTTEMCDFRDSQAVFDHVNAAAVGFSADTPPSLIEFSKQNKFRHGIFSDPSSKVLDQIWQTETNSGVEHRAKRGWMIVGHDGKVLEQWVAPDSSKWSGIGPINAALHKAVPHTH